MAARIEVIFVKKQDSDNPNERIITIGGVNNNDTRWRLTQDQAIRGIEDGLYSFYVDEDGQAIDVVVGVHDGKKYLKAGTNGTGKDHLLELPEIP
jgi:hypothetical protein